ncbi:hypothetical protein H1R17_12855 [Flavobacterium sp. xlx-214]|uniref:hypothetical protein n=1 Tax=unclassified Flavobacterium TaxID=196869 RepID=UPI0013D8180B|nr:MULTISPECIES: hypothetical protein [unclassified Flavobacterium]MBA5791520.1 hypothetical protein [Flavobacterium sp. xlx-221]QMI83330.1 hypothetical protein H1R17_12855 [Flavobacterium sp. xlx-214]
MTKRTPIPCPECAREKYFEGLCYACNSRKLRLHYELMTQEQVAATIANIIDQIETIEDWDKVYKDFIGLLAYQDINTKEIAKAAFRKNIFHPPTLYRNASDEIQDQLIALIKQPNCSSASAILNCLSIIGSKKVQDVFFELEKNPLPWRKNLYVDPSFYAGLGGWTFNNDGERVALQYKECYALLEDERTDNAVKVSTVTGAHCTVCNCAVVNILTLDGTDERLRFLELSGTIQLPICPNCASMCEKTIIQYQVNGTSTFEMIDPFVTENYLSEEAIQKLTNNHLRLSLTPKPIYYACGNDDVSTIGGSPEWVQDWQYENCPNCQKKMKLLAAISWDQLMEYTEGTLYIENCNSCSIAVAFHQQT